VPHLSRERPPSRWGQGPFFAVVGCWLASHPPEVGSSGRGGHPHRAEVGLDDLSFHGISSTADVAPATPAELMARPDLAGQRPTLVVMRAASTDCVSGVHP